MEDKLSTDATELAQQRTELALQRTIIAAERTLMAWIRTAISMIGFGFTIYKFFQYLREAEGFHRSRPIAPRNLGLTFITIGVFTLVGAIWQHQDFLKRIGAEEKRYMWSMAVIVSILVILIGVIVFISTLLKIGPF